jgi:hypothetical protein
MNFDINDAINQMTGAIEDKLQGDWSAIQSTVVDFFNDSKNRLAILANQRINKEIDDDFLNERLGDEKDMLQADFDALKIIAKSDAQQAINAAFDILQDAIKKAISI